MPVSPPLPGQSGHHAVQFYSDDRKLCGAVADFLGDGIAAGQPCLVIAIPKHREAIVGELKARHFDVDALMKNGDLMLLDAVETLAQITRDGEIDDARLAADVAAAIGRLRRGRGECVIRGYGEMVDLLWRAGNVDAAIRLEALWGEIARTQSLSVLCGYALAGFYTDATALERVCEQHTHSEILCTCSA